jgi:hypothetical protein
MKHFGKRQLFRARMNSRSAARSIATPSQGAAHHIVVLHWGKHALPESGTGNGKARKKHATKFPIRGRGCGMRLLYND